LWIAGPSMVGDFHPLISTGLPAHTVFIYSINSSSEFFKSPVRDWCEGVEVALNFASGFAQDAFLVRITDGFVLHAGNFRKLGGG
ncbi:hypothetical protein BME18_22325, partial [Klebsiella michiganensis]